MGKHKKKHPQYVATRQQIIEVNQEQVAVECLQMHELLINRTKKLRQLTDQDMVYIISTKWLNEWKQYVGYEALVSESQQKHFKKNKKNRRKPGKINTDLYTSPTQFYQIPAQMVQYQFLNNHISEKKTKDDDFIAVTRQIWMSFTELYEGVEIQRPIRKNKSSTYYDGELLKIDMVFVNWEESLEDNIKKTAKKNYKEIFSSDKMNLSNLWKYDDLHAFLTDYCKIIYGEQQIKIWKCYSYMATNPIVQSLVQTIIQKKYLIKGKQLLSTQKNKELDLDDYIKSTYTLVVEAGTSKFISQPKSQQLRGYCQQCIEKKELLIMCMCGQVDYCSEKCRVADQSYHFNVCDVVFDSQDDEEYEKMVFKDKKKMNKEIGLKNIGNTCYMNSVLQSLFSLDFFKYFFVTNTFLNELNPKQVEENKAIFVKKLSKTFKILCDTNQSLIPWSLKGQIDYFLSPFKGDKQHDANDFLVNFLNTINQFLKKKQDQAYHPIIENNFIGKFKSTVICPDCEVQIVNDQIFLQISLPLKSKPKAQSYQYAIIQNYKKCQKGRAQVEDTWQGMKKGLNAPKSKIFMNRQPQGVRQVQLDRAPQKVAKNAKGDLLFYKNLDWDQNQHVFVFNMINYKVIGGSNFKNAYGYPLLIPINTFTTTLGTFWLQVIKQYFFDNKQIFEQAEQLQKSYFKQIQKITVQQAKLAMQKQTKVCKKQTIKGEQEEPESEQIKNLVANYTEKLKTFAEKIGIQLFINNFKRKKNNICSFCNKKCQHCPVSFEFDNAFDNFFEDRFNEIKFEVKLKDTPQIQTKNLDMASAGQPCLQDCFQLFKQPQKLDQENAWYCQRCDMMRLALKQIEIKTFPKILIIHLNRFKNNFQGKKLKNSDPIQYKQIEKFGEHEYKLNSVIVHEGSMEGGHYWSICLRQGNYFIFNDHKVTQTDNIFSKNAYILLYEKIQ